MPMRGLAGAIALGALMVWVSSTAALALGSEHLRETVASCDGCTLAVKTATGDVTK